MLSLEEFAKHEPEKQRQFLKDVLEWVSKNLVLVNIKTIVMSEIEMDGEFLNVLYELIVHIIEVKKNRDHTLSMETLKKLQEHDLLDHKALDDELDEILAKME